MFRPINNSQADLDAYERQRLQQAALAQAAQLPPAPEQLPPEPPPAPAPLSEQEPPPVPADDPRRPQFIDPQAATRVPALPPEPAPSAPGPEPAPSAPGPAQAAPAMTRLTAPPPPPDAAPAPSEDKGPSPWWTALETVPNAIGNIMGATSHVEDTQNVLGNRAQERNQDTSRIIARGDAEQGAFQTRKRLENKQAFNEARQGRRDANQEAYQGRQEARQGRLDEQNTAQIQRNNSLGDAERDPASPANMAFREAVKAAYPGKFDDETLSHLTVADARALSPVTGKADREDALRVKAGATQQNFENQKELIKYRQDIKPKKAAGSLAGSGSADQDVQAALDSLEADYKTAGQPVPESTKSRIKLAGSIRDGNKRVAAINSALAQVPTATRQDAHAAAQNKQTDLKERQAYEKMEEGPRKALSNVNDIEKFLQAHGSVQSLDNYQGEDIPGYGRFGQHMHNLLVTGDAQSVRQKVRRLVQSAVLDTSGRVATDSERREIASVVGSMDSMGQEQLAGGLARIRQIAREQLKRAKSLYKGAAGEFEQNMNAPDDSTDYESVP